MSCCNEQNAGIILCQCKDAKLISQDVLNQTRRQFLNKDQDIWIVDDLCYLAAKEKEKLQAFAAKNPLKVMACHERAVKSILQFGGVHTDDLKFPIESVDLRSQSTDSPVETICDCELNKKGNIHFSEKNDAWHAWYPVIDYELCTDCGQCSSFCLFSVYEQDSETGEVIVENPDHCKNNCPACARTCPAVAIIFPKLDEAPINGKFLTDEEMKNANVQLDINDITNSETYQRYALENANPKRGRLISMLNKSNETCPCKQLTDR